MGIPESHPAIQTAYAKGLIDPPASFGVIPAAGKRSKPKLVAAGFAPPGTWTVPLHVVSGDNRHTGTKSRIGRSGHERRAVYRSLARTHRELAPFADAAQAGRPVVCRLVRLGGGEMDDDGLRASLKYVRDAVADFLGVDDGRRGPVRWDYADEPGGPAGVRIVLTMEA